MEQPSSIFDRNAPRELIHQVYRLGETQPSLPDKRIPVNLVEETVASESAKRPDVIDMSACVSTRSGQDAETINRLVGEVSGIRSELGAMRDSFDAFRGDFARFTTVIEGLVSV